MKITIQKAEEQKPESKYPYVGIHGFQKDIVLFHKERCGILLECISKEFEIGEYRTDWLESGFAPFNGTIKIEQ